MWCFGVRTKVPPGRSAANRETITFSDIPAPITWQKRDGMPDHQRRPRRVWATMKPSHGEAATQTPSSRASPTCQGMFWRPTARSSIG